MHEYKHFYKDPCCTICAYIRINIKKMAFLDRKPVAPFPALCKACFPQKHTTVSLKSI